MLNTSSRTGQKLLVQHNTYLTYVTISTMDSKQPVQTSEGNYAEDHKGCLNTHVCSRTVREQCTVESSRQAGTDKHNITQVQGCWSYEKVASKWVSFVRLLQCGSSHGRLCLPSSTGWATHATGCFFIIFHLSLALYRTGCLPLSSLLLLLTRL